MELNLLVCLQHYNIGGVVSIEHVHARADQFFFSIERVSLAQLAHEDADVKCSRSEACNRYYLGPLAFFQ